MMNNKEFADKAISAAKQYNIAYCWGAFGHVNTQQNIDRLLNQYPENKEYLAKMKQADFFTDCSGLVKMLIWSWNGDKSKTYGGATYCSNGLNDVNAAMLRGLCTGLSTDFSNIQIGELVFNADASHVGIYTGNNIVVEATPSFTGKVQTTGLGNKGGVSGLNTRSWSSHGKLSSCIDYSATTSSADTSTQINYKQAIPARYFSKGYAGEYRVQPSIGVNARSGPGTSYSIIKALPCGSIVTNYGYYSMDSQNRVWLYVVIPGGNVAYICKDYLI